jgi:hypothetical protein
MAAPINTYNSAIDLRIGHVPQVDENNIDPDLYKELLDIHDAIVAIASGAASADTSFATWLAKFRKVITISDTSSPYAISTQDGIIRVDASAGDVNLILPSSVTTSGYEYKIKRIDLAPTTFVVNLTGSAGELVDGHALGVCISPLSSYTVKSNAAGYDII